MIRFSPGQSTWTRRLYWGQENGSGKMQWVGRPRSATIVKSRKQHWCKCCGAPIAAGQLHGADRYIRWTDHYCLDCLVSTRPAKQYKALNDPPSQEERDSNPHPRWASR